MNDTTLYHFTGLGHIANILHDGFIKAHIDRERPDPFTWFTISPNGDKNMSSQPFPLARITMKPNFGAVKFDRAEHWEKHQTKEHIAANDRGKEIHGYVESDWWVHLGNVGVEHIASIDMKRDRMTPWERIDVKVLSRRENPMGTFFTIGELTFAMIDIGKHKVSRVPGKQGWVLVRVFDFGTPEEKIVFPSQGVLFMLDAQMKKVPYKEL